MVVLFAMQYDWALDRLIMEVVIYNLALGLVHVHKADASDNFYRIGLLPPGIYFVSRRRRAGSNISHPPYGEEELATHIFHGDRDSGGFIKCSHGLQHTSPNS